jgi:general stress protein 26
MKHTPYFVFLTIAISIFFGLTVNAQTSDRNDRDKKLEVAAEVIEASQYCALITLDSLGAPRSRAMDPFPLEEGFVIWFGTNSHSRKVKEIRNDSRVNLYYFDKELSAYVTLFGHAEIVNDKAAKEKYWKKEWEAFYSDKEKDYCLIKFVPEWMEVISNSHGIFGDTVTWTPEILNLNN